MAEDGFAKALKAWHASPYDFDKFRHPKEVSGSGQGAASYGHGIYVAENPKISGPGESAYMVEFSRHHAVGPMMKKWHIQHDEGWYPLEDASFDQMADPQAMTETFNRYGAHSAASDWLASHLSQDQNQRDPSLLDKIKKRLEKSDDKTFAEWMNTESDRDPEVEDEESLYQPHHAAMIRKALGGDLGDLFKFGSDEVKGPHSYEVRLHVQPETLLDWDELIDNHHPEVIRKLKSLKGPAGDEFRDLEPGDDITGRDIYEILTEHHGSNYEASEALYNVGIHGIRYLDGDSRARAKAGLNFQGKPVESLQYESPEYNARVKADPDYKILHAMKDVFKEAKFNVSNMEELRNHFETEAGFGDEFSKDVLKFMDKHAHELKLVPDRENLTYNYVIFHPDFVEAVSQYNIKGEKVRDIAGVHLKSVDHDPFKGE